jgi:hypothetical protein
MNFEITKINVRRDSYTNRKGELAKWSNKLYIFTEGETILENLVNRRSKPHQFYKAEIIPKVLVMITDEQIIKELLSNPKAKWGWSQKCGCSMCPCSPGFIQRGGSDSMLTVYVNVKFS